MPEYDFVERHSIAIRASPAVVDSCIQALDLCACWDVRVVFACRGLPASSLRLDGMQELGFSRLAYQPGAELVLRLIGRFWTLRGGIERFTAPEFAEFVKPGYAKAAWNFR